MFSQVVVVIIASVLVYGAGVLSCTVFHDPHFTVGASGDRRFSTRSLNRIVEFLFGTFRLVAWATKGHKMSEFLLDGMYGQSRPGYMVRRLVATT